MISKSDFEKSLLSPLAYWQDKSSKEVEELLSKDAAAMVGFEQHNPHHCFNLFDHTLHAIDYLKTKANPLLRTAAFFHDIGKPQAAFQKQDRLVFYGHAKKSAKIARPILKELGYTPQEVEELCFYIGHHDDFISWILPEEKANPKYKTLPVISKENLQRFIEKNTKKMSGEAFVPTLQTWHNLLDLAEADASAQADEVYRNGELIDSKEHKLKKVQALRSALNEIEQEECHPISD
jgi:putative nucleotidyltransferase with HDIG domain